MTDLKKDTTSASEEILPANKMGTMPVNKLLLSMSVPMMLSMLVQAMYNIVDSIFVAQINEDALTALSLAFPIQTLMIAILGGTSVGINAFLLDFICKSFFTLLLPCSSVYFTFCGTALALWFVI